MAIINSSFKFIFVHIPKTAGTSVTGALQTYSRYCDLEIGGTDFGEKIAQLYQKRFGLAKHSTASEIRAVVGNDLWSQMFSFAFVRNPFNRCFSTFKFLRKWEVDATNFPESRKDAAANFSSRIKSFSNFDEYVLSDIWDETDGPDFIFREQMHWLCDKPNSKTSLVNFVAKVENVDDDFAHIIETIGKRESKEEFILLPKLNRSGLSTEFKTKNQKVIDKILTKYQIDFEEFNYPQTPP